MKISIQAIQSIPMELLNRIVKFNDRSFLN